MDSHFVQTEAMLSKDEVMSILLLNTVDGCSYAQKIYNVISYSILKYQEKHSADRYLHSKTTKANIIHDYIKNDVVVLSLEDTNIRIFKQQGMFTLILMNKVIFRFKKLDSDKKSRNVKTKQAESFKNQQLPFIGTEQSIVRLDAGYLLDVLGRDLKGVYFVKPKTKDSVGWRISAELELSVNDQIPLFSLKRTDFEDVLTIKPHLKDNESNKTGS